MHSISWSDLTDEQQQKALEIYERGKSGTYEEISEALGVGPLSPSAQAKIRGKANRKEKQNVRIAIETVREVLPDGFLRDVGFLSAKDLSKKYALQLDEIKKLQTMVGAAGGQVYGVPGATIPDLKSGTPHIQADDFIVACDLEIPRHIPEGVALVCEIAEILQIKTLVLGGDAFVGDGFSKWVLQWAMGTYATREEVETGIHVLTRLGRTFDRVLWISGNHEYRLPAAVGAELNYGDLFRTLLGDGVQFSEYAVANIETSSGDWQVIHPGNYSKVPLSVTRDIAEVEGINVIGGHTHHLAMGLTKCGRYWCIDGGCLTDGNRAAYKTMKKTRHPKWNPGFVVVFQGYPYLVHVEKCNLDFWWRLARW